MKPEMLNLRNKVAQERERRVPQRRPSLRSQLLSNEIPDVGANTPPTCTIRFPNHDDLRCFVITVSPDSGLWKGGKFLFEVSIPEEYNMKPPNVVCKTRVWHPNIALQGGGVCLSLLRTGAPDGLGWTPARTLKEVVWGVDALFSDLLNPDDPLNIDAAEQYKRDQTAFRRKVLEYISQDQYQRKT